MKRSIDAAYAASGPMLYAGCQAIVLLIIARKGGATDTAHFYLAQAIATPLGQFVSLRLKEQLATEAHQTFFLDRIRRQFLVAIVCFFFSCIGWLLLSDGSITIIGISVLLANIAQGFVAAFQGRRARSKEFFLASQSDTLLGLLSLISIAIGYQFAGLQTGTILMAATWSAVAVVLVLFELRRDRGRENLRSGRDLPLRHDLLLGIARATEVGQISAARLGVGIFAGTGDLARLGTGSFFVRIGAPIIGGIRSTMGADLGEAAKAGKIDALLDRLRKRLFRAAIGGGLVGAAVGWAVVPWLIALTYGEPVAPSRSTAALLLFGAAFLYASMLLAQAVIAGGRNVSVLSANLAAVTSTAVLVIPMSLLWGQTGGAAVLAIGYAIRFAVLYHAITRRTDNQWKPGLPFLSSMIIHAVFASSGVLVWQILQPQSDPIPTNPRTIFVLAGGSGERFERGFELWEQYPTANFVLSLPDDYLGPHAQEVRAHCDTSDLVMCIAPVPDSTAGEIATIASFASQPQRESTVIVTSDSHVDRVQRWVDRCSPDGDIAVIGSPSRYNTSRLLREFLATLDSLLTQRHCPDSG